MTDELERPFARCDLDLLEEDLISPGLVVVVADNAGEAVFDKPLIRYLGQNHDVVFAVRSEPIINDATLPDAQKAGMSGVTRVVSTGCAAPGLLLNSASPEFLDLLGRADVVLSKGQGNFEALAGTTQRRVYFLLKAKCIRIASALGVAVGDYSLVAVDPSIRDSCSPTATARSHALAW